MTQVITATYADGIFRPDEEPVFSPGTRVRLVVEPLQQAPDSAVQAWEDLERLCADSPLDSGGVRLTRDELHERR